MLTECSLSPPLPHWYNFIIVTWGNLSKITPCFITNTFPPLHHTCTTVRSTHSIHTLSTYSTWNRASTPCSPHLITIPVYPHLLPLIIIINLLFISSGIACICCGHLFIFYHIFDARASHNFGLCGWVFNWSRISGLTLYDPGGGALKPPPLRFFALTHLILELHYCALVTFPKK